MNSVMRSLRSFFTGRFFLSFLCLSLAGVGAFVVLPRMYKDQEATLVVARVKERVESGAVIEARHLEFIEVGAYNLPAQVLLSESEIVGFYAKATLYPGDYVYAEKIGSYRINAVMDTFLAANQKLVTVTPKNAAQVLAAHLAPGDIVAVATIREMRLAGGEIQSVLDYPAALSNLQVYDVENSRGASLGSSRSSASSVQITSLQSSGTEDMVPRSVTFIVSDEQAALLLNAEYNGGFHVIFRDRRP